MRYRGKKPGNSSTFWWALASILTLALAVLFCVKFIRNLIEWGMCV